MSHIKVKPLSSTSGQGSTRIPSREAVETRDGRCLVIVGSRDFRSDSNGRREVSPLPAERSAASGRSHYRGRPGLGEAMCDAPLHCGFMQALPLGEAALNLAALGHAVLKCMHICMLPRLKRSGLQIVRQGHAVARKRETEREGKMLHAGKPHACQKASGSTIGTIARP